jgi:hypothetical protein
MNTTERLMRYAREYRATHGSIYEPISPVVQIPRLVKVWEPERDLSKGAHVCAESEAMRRGRVPMIRKNPASN